MNNLDNCINYQSSTHKSDNTFASKHKNSVKHFDALQNGTSETEPAEIFVAICTSNLRILVLFSKTQKNIKSNKCQETRQPIFRLHTAVNNQDQNLYKDYQERIGTDL